MAVLWTDWLIYLLVLAVAVTSIFVVGKPQLQRPLAKITANKTGMLSLVVLLFFISIGLLDSIHFKHWDKSEEDHVATNEIVSLLDYFATPIRTQMEKTYSSPFATQLYSKEIVITKEGGKYWAYPRLHHGGAHLPHPQTQKWRDISLKGGIGFSKGLAVYILLMLAGRFLLRAQKITLHTSTCRAVCGLVFFLSTGSATMIELSSYYHILGTDKVGEDVFYQAIKGIRTGLVIGSLTTLVMLPLAVIFGIMAGFFRGWVDDVIAYLYTTLNSIPSVLLIAASILMVQVYMANHPDDFTNPLVRADMRLLFLCLILGVTSWTGLCRLLRAETLKLREMEYVQAARALGVKQSMILFRHILPNVMHIVLISVVLDFSSLVLAEAVLSYINIGVDPTTYSWGNMINGARLEMAREPVVWWSLTASFVFMFSLVLAANLFADCVRDAFDPRRTDG
jgi:peptide/nickel transport system permease protein